jgi:hypothetical protein
LCAVPAPEGAPLSSLACTKAVPHRSFSQGTRGGGLFPALARELKLRADGGRESAFRSAGWVSQPRATSEEDADAETKPEISLRLLHHAALGLVLIAGGLLVSGGTGPPRALSGLGPSR